MADPVDKTQVDDQFGPFTIAEVEQCFQAFDLDENGFVGASELRKVYQVLGENVTDEDIDEMLRMCDQDGDGQMDFDEFAKMIFRHSGPPKIGKKPKTRLISDNEAADIMLSETAMTQALKEPSNVSPSNKLPPIKQKTGLSSHGGGGGGGMESSMSLTESIMNTSGSPSKLRKKELIKQREKVLTTRERADRALVLNNMIQVLNFENKNLDDVQSSFAKYDELDQGYVNYQQFAAALGEDMNNDIVKTLFGLFEWNDKVDYREFLISVVNITATNRDQKIRYAFNIFDTDNNGYIDKDELIKILKSAHMTSYEQVESKARSILKAADQDGNDLLTLDELTTVVKKFPNLVFPDFNIFNKK